MSYTAKDHAFVYGVIVQEAFRLYPDCETAVVEGIKVYGRQRGARMAQVAAACGCPNTMQYYLAFGEWAPAPGEMDIRIPEASPSAVWNVHKCPWQQQWAESDMLSVGKLYCDFVDYELVKGFNSDLELGLGTTQTKGDEFCYFKWNGADMTPEAGAENEAAKAKIGNAKLRPWSYHMAHIYKTMGECLKDALGQEAVDAIYAAVDTRLAEKFGADCVDMLHAGRMLDFWVTPADKNAKALEQLF